MTTILNINSGIISVAGSIHVGPKNPDTYEGLILAAGPVAYWRMDETAGPTLADATGNGHTATENGASMRYQEAGLITGAPDNMFSAGGNNVLADHWNFGSNAAFEPTDAISVELWVRPPGSNEALFSYSSQNASEMAGYKIIYGFNEQRFRWYVGTTDGPNGNTNGNAYIKDPGNSAFNQNYHVVGTYTSGSRILYVNGVEVESDGKTGNIQYPTVSGVAPVGLLGNEYFNGNLQGPQPATALSGLLDEVAVYNRVLTPTEVLNHYNAGVSGIFP